MGKATPDEQEEARETPPQNRSGSAGKSRWIAAVTSPFASQVAVGTLVLTVVVVLHRDVSRAQDRILDTFSEKFTPKVEENTKQLAVLSEQIRQLVEAMKDHSKLPGHQAMDARVASLEAMVQMLTKQVERLESKK